MHDLGRLLFPLAQLPTSTSAEIGGWLVAFAAIVVIVGACLGIAVAIKTLRQPGPGPPPISQSFVTYETFSAFQQEIRRDINDFKKEVTEKLERASAELRDQLKVLDAYTRDAFHRQATAIQGVVAGLAWLKGVLGARKPLPNEHVEEEQ